jgi:hypothetical protein
MGTLLAMLSSPAKAGDSVRRNLIESQCRF